MTDSFPRLRALTGRFTHGSPSHFRISPDGERLFYLQSAGPLDSVQRLMRRCASNSWEPEVLFDPSTSAEISSDLPAAERARRERLRESGGGIVAYSVDINFRVATFALGGLVHVLDLETANTTTLATAAAVDPQVDPTGERVAWVEDNSLHMSRIDGSEQASLLTASTDSESWGLANFLAAEEFDRTRGFWWAPDGASLLVEQVDDSKVPTWSLADPTYPQAEVRSSHYPAAGATNPDVRLWHVYLDASKREIRWDRQRWEYLVSVRWNARGPALITLYNRAQTAAVVTTLDPTSGDLSPVHHDNDPAWVSMIPGTPNWSCDGELITSTRTDNQESIAVGSEVVRLPERMQVSAVVNVEADRIVLETQPDATTLTLTSVASDGSLQHLTALTGYTVGLVAGGTSVEVSTRLNTVDWRRSVVSLSSDAPANTDIQTLAATPPIALNLAHLELGPDRLNAVVAWPTGFERGSERLPIVMNPYGGPHAQRVINVGRAFAQAQWLADQGFAVLVVDGHGSPGRGPAWERSINGDLATLPLADQVAAVEDFGDRFSAEVDVTRVGITGWSFGGYLAALAVLRRPDIFTCAVAGAPVTDWRWYDSAYTERYLGDPEANSDAYDSCSLIPLAPSLSRPLMIIHGLADDNVFATHSLRLSAELTSAGRPHTFVPLPAVSHMTPQVEIAENLMNLELDFYRANLQSEGRNP